MTTATSVVCRVCGADRVRRWEAARKTNGLSAAEWPKPVAPEFEDVVALARHVEKRHR